MREGRGGEHLPGFPAASPAPWLCRRGQYLVEGGQQPRGLAGEAEALLHGGDGALEVAGHHELRQLQQAVAQHEGLGAGAGGRRGRDRVRGTDTGGAGGGGGRQAASGARGERALLGQRVGSRVPWGSGGHLKFTGLRLGSSWGQGWWEPSVPRGLPGWTRSPPVPRKLPRSHLAPPHPALA